MSLTSSFPIRPFFFGFKSIGVLTKADALLPGEHDRWIEILRNKRYPLKLGYFVCKQPGAADLKLNNSFAHSRAAEKTYFNTTTPWSTLPFDIQAKFGTDKLTAFLSERLSQYISEK